MKIIGTVLTSFTPKDSDKLIEGTTIYLTEPLDPERGGKGERAEKIFLSANKAAKLDFVPAVGMEVSVSFNRWGKVETLYLLDHSIDFGTTNGTP